MSQWLSVGVTALIQLVIAAYVYGELSRTSKDHERRLNQNDADHKDIWGRVSNQGEDIGKIKGRLGINGGRAYGASNGE